MAVEASRSAKGTSTASDNSRTISAIETFLSEEEYRAFAETLHIRHVKPSKEALEDNQIDIQAYISKRLGYTIDKHAELGESRQHGFHKGVATFQQFVVCLSKLVDSYGSVVDLLQDSGVPYAKLGFQILAGLLRPARSKSTIDASMCVQLKQICDAFPRLQLLEKAYHGRSELRDPWLQIHIGILQWADEASQYFTSLRKRALGMITGSSTEGIYNKLVNLLLQVSQWTSTFLHENVTDLVERSKEASRQAEIQEQRLRSVQLELSTQATKLEAINNKLQTQENNLDLLKTTTLELEAGVSKMREEESEQQRQQDADKYDALKGILCGQRSLMGVVSIEKLLEEVNKSLRFRYHHTGAYRTHAWSKEDLLERDDFRSWRLSDKCRMLVLGTDKRLSTTDYSWLSSGLLDFALALEVEQRDDPPSPFAFYTCHPDHWTSEDQPVDFIDVVTSIIAQIVRGNKALLRKKQVRSIDQEKVARWRRYWRREEPDAMIEELVALFDLASQQRSLYVVIDRLDACKDFESSGIYLLKLCERLIQRSQNTKLLISVLPRETHNVRACRGFLVDRDVVEGDLSLEAVVKPC